MAEQRKHLVVGILKFLDEQKQEGGLKEEAVESLEVASQCLESAFDFDSEENPNVNKEALFAKYPLPGSLSEIFQAGLKHMNPCEKKVSVADKEAADKLKGEGNDFMKQDKISDAIDCYTRAIALDSTNAVYYCNRAAAYNKLSQFDQAIVDCSEALNIDPQYSKAYNRKGVAHMSLQQHQEARDCFALALELDPGNENYKQSLEQIEQRLQEAQRTSSNTGAGPGGLGGLNLGGLDLSSMLNNPQLMNMASAMMSNPGMQQMMANMMGSSGSGGGGGGGGVQGGEGIGSLLQAGQQLAQQMQQQNPELVEQLRNTMRPEDGSSGGDGGSSGGPDSTTGASGGSS